MNIDRSHSHSPNINIDRNNDRSILRPPVVVYITGDAGAKELRVCGAIESILQGYGIESQRQLASSDFLSDLGNRLGFVKCPRVFFRGRYIGGLIEVQDAYQLEAPSAVCTACGGHKFTLLHAIDDDKLINCSACSNDSSITQQGSSQTKLFICFQGKDIQQRHIYVICSLDAQQPRLYNITKEAVIYGYPYMGFGVYDSKIVLAGGQSTMDNTTHNGCFTFDMGNHSVDYNPFVFMTHGKYKPLLFQLGKRLYVCNSQYDSTIKEDVFPIEIYSPAVKTRWHAMSNIFDWSDVYSSRHMLVNYSCLVFGNTCFMSTVPFTDDTWITHCNYNHHLWMPYSDSPLPFTGVATFHSQDGFDDFVMIYFDKGAVKVCKFDFSGFGASQELFKPHKSDENIQGYFADFGMGCFCLTTFDKFRVYVCTFVVTREGTPSDPLKVTHRIQSKHVFHYDKLFTDGMTISSVVGCSVPTQNQEAKSRAEKSEANFYKCYRKMKDDYDPVEAENMDSLVSLIHEDADCWSREKYSEGEEFEWF
ncbi:hypothetical protein OROHE_021345 [Orobanche hederae]